MIQPIPKWMQIKFSQLWSHFEDKPFTMEQCKDVFPDERRVIIAVILSKLRSMGWLSVTIDENDRRRRIYQLVDPRIVIGEIAVQR